MGQPRYANGFDVTLHEDLVSLPLTWKKPRTIFVNSMSDLFHHDVPTEFVERLFATMHEASWHTFQILTKRSERLAILGKNLPWPRNIWMGVSVETEEFTNRIDHLRTVRAAVRFLSLEPLLGPLPALNLEGVDWVIVGGESGPGARPMNPTWVKDIKRQCSFAGVPFFFKQWGGVRKDLAGRKLNGRTWDALPTPVLRHPAAELELALSSPS
jgi:protein gp37